jgi:hypothetical protein
LFSEVGRQHVVIDSVGDSAAVIEMIEVRRVRIADIDLRRVLDDGDESVANWRAAHEECWHSAEMREVLDERGAGSTVQAGAHALKAVLPCPSPPAGNGNPLAARVRPEGIRCI